NGSADNVYDLTSLRAKASRSRPFQNGFLLAAIQGRNLHYPNGNPDGAHHDVYYRSLASPSANPDFRNLHRFIDATVAAGGVDRQRIYVMGWSNGAFFGQEYAIARHDQPTPGGNRIAAAVAYAGADPFQSPRAEVVPACDLHGVPRSSLPIL